MTRIPAPSRPSFAAGLPDTPSSLEPLSMDQDDPAAAAGGALDPEVDPGIAPVLERLAFLQDIPRTAATGQSSDAGYQHLIFSGLPAGYEAARQREPRSLFHYTSRANAETILRQQALLAGEAPYVLAIDAGLERIRCEYRDLTGLFFVDRLLEYGARGFVGATDANTALRVTIPRGMPLFTLPSFLPDLPFFLIPLEAGASILLGVELVPNA
jgi:hypothetical protein